MFVSFRNYVDLFGNFYFYCITFLYKLYFERINFAFVARYEDTGRPASSGFERSSRIQSWGDWERRTRHDSRRRHRVHS